MPLKMMPLKMMPLKMMPLKMLAREVTDLEIACMGGSSPFRGLRGRPLASSKEASSRGAGAWWLRDETAGMLHRPFLAARGPPPAWGCLFSEPAEGFCYLTRYRLRGPDAKRYKRRTEFMPFEQTNVKP
jgi:hypothetical protein